MRQGPDYFRAEEVEKYFEKNRGKLLDLDDGEEGKLKWAFERKNSGKCGERPRLDAAEEKH